ncbi:MAG: dTDP-4-dehydrorhamnose 3,5-epimerase [Anaerolineales bacterium]|nr:dTDP-4-dehydrorhamnose 3,5-epimerase [Anaerolineales bacterium]
MEFVQTKIPDILIIEPQVYGDERGFFLETFRENKFIEAGIVEKFVQENHSSSQKGVLRGLHYQIKQTQGKLVRAIAGEILDIAVDLRRSSPTFSQWVGIILSETNKRQLWIPKGFAHGFYVLSEQAEVTYKVTDYYAPEWERSILWDDPQLGIDWQISTPPILSPKDLAGKSFQNAEIFE